MVLLLHTLVLDILAEGLFLGFGLLEFFSVFFLHSFDHIIKLLDMPVMSLLHLFSFSHELIFQNRSIPPKLFLKTPDPRILN